ncbi:MAG: hypothetical protein HYS77_10630 [Candidatus Rokubacteria bacterium]|nr:hypothetical protein [Candidatus Rokubacteria bacterium]
MGAMMYPSVEGVRAAATMLHRLGVIDRLPAPDEFIDLNLIARLETEGLFRRLLGVA